jgi:hypothetical protein
LTSLSIHDAGIFVATDDGISETLEWGDLGAVNSLLKELGIGVGFI